MSKITGFLARVWKDDEVLRGAAHIAVAVGIAVVKQLWTGSRSAGDYPAA